MPKTLLSIFLSSLISVGFCEANADLYQIDMIIFAHENPNHTEKTLEVPLVNINRHSTIPLTDSSDPEAPYQLLPASRSSLKKELWALKHRSHYQVIRQFSWLQPEHNRKAVRLPETLKNNWQLKGTVLVRQDHYFSLNTHLIFANEKQSIAPFLFLQNQKLKPKTVYYLDHPLVGMLIQIT